MHELQRKHFVRTLFVLLCVLPTMLICALSVWLRTSIYRDRVAAVFERRIGTAVRIEDITYPRPYVTRIFGLEVIDAETSNLLIESDRLDVVRTNLGYEINGDLVLYTNLAEAWRIINHRLLAQRWGDSVERVTLRCHRLTWKSQVASQLFRQVKCDLKTSSSDLDLEVQTRGLNAGSLPDHLASVPNGPSLHVGFYTDSAETSKEAEHGELTLFRFTSAGRSRTVASLRTKGQFIRPAVLRPEWFPFVGESKLDLELYALCDSNAWQGEATNVNWVGLSGHRLLNEQFAPLRMIGDFNVRNASVTFEQSFVRSIAGELECDHGQISRQLIQRLVDKGFRLNEEPQSAIADFHRLHARFQLQGDGSHVEGVHAASSGTTRPAIIHGDTFQLSPPDQSLTITELISVLVSPNNTRSVIMIENLRRMLPLDQIRVADRP